MMRRFAILGSILLGLSVLAAIGLAQNGERRQTGSTSLADRLAALRQAVTKDAEPTSPSAATAMDEERSVVSRRSIAADAAITQPPVRSTAPVEQESEERVRRPKLLSALDPLNILSLGDEEAAESPSASAQLPPARAQLRAPAELRRDPAAVRTDRSAEERPVVPPVERHYQARRSPLVRETDRPAEDAERLLSSQGTTALGPADAGSAKLPSLARSAAGVTTGVEVRDVRPADDWAPIDVPDEHSLPKASAIASDSSPTTRRPPLTENPVDRHSQSTTPATDEPPAADVTADELTEDELVEAEAADPSPNYGAGLADAGEAENVEDEIVEGVVSDDVTGIDYRTGSPAPPANAVQESASDSAASASQQAAKPAVDSGIDRVLSSDESPAVAWNVAGPRQIIVGREAMFEVHLRNEGDQAAQRMVCRVEVPTTAEIRSAEASHGVGQRVEDGASAAVLEWRVDQLSAGREALLKLLVVPRTSQPLNLQVSVRSEPRAAVARVEVLEPKLKLALEGPSDVLYGEARTYRVTVTNPGTGPAENVVVLITPPGQEEKSVQRHELGALPAGQAKTLDLEVTPQKAGNLAMSAVVSGDGDLRDQAERRVLVRKPELVVDARGPRTTYAGTVATYFFRVQNTGDAVANDVHVNAHLPLGAEFVRATDDRKLEPETDKNSVKWVIGAIPPGEAFFMELKCIVNWAGDNTLEVAAEAAKGDLRNNKSISTHVVALADLKLEVGDPKGPVPVGKEAVYEVRVRNRGANTAEQVNVVALFSEGIDPVGAEGGQHAIENGRVAFRTIESLPAGREIVFKVRAIAKQPGTHVFRAEVLCRELETKLAAEGTTRFYLDEAAAVRADGDVQSAAIAERFESRQ